MIKKYNTHEELLETNDIVFYTDGATFNNGRKKENLPSLGGWGFCAVDSDNKIIAERRGWPEEETTISRMELQGAIEAVKFAIKNFTTAENYSDKINIAIVTDSQYVGMGAAEWLKGWIKRGWRNNQGDPTPNKDLWSYLGSIAGILGPTTVDVVWVKIKGHSNNKYNDIADRLAGEALSECRSFHKV